MTRSIKLSPASSLVTNLAREARSKGHATVNVNSKMSVDVIEATVTRGARLQFKVNGFVRSAFDVTAYVHDLYQRHKAE